MAKKTKQNKKTVRITRKQKKNLQKSSSSADPEDLNSQLRELGLCTKNITGDGNCLFRSLSDQFYGHDGNHKEIRQRICQYLRENEDEYKLFVEDDQSFEHHVETMSQNGTFGGHMELAVFVKLEDVDIKVYQPGMIYVINGPNDDNEDKDQQKQTLHIAYHSWEHYDSVRNVDGPFSGLPEIKLNGQTTEDYDIDEGDDEICKQEQEPLLDSKVKELLEACPDTNVRELHQLLIKHKGDVNKVIDAIYDSEYQTPAVTVNTNDYTKDKDEKEAPAILPIELVPKQQENSPLNDAEVPVNTTIESIEPIVLIDEKQVKIEEKEPYISSVVVELAIPKEEDNNDSAENVIVENEKHKKKLSASDRKREKKRLQKEAKVAKDRAKAERRVKYNEEKESAISEKQHDADNILAKNTLKMKELHI